MTATVNDVLARLPAYEDRWQTVRDKQYVPDIINEVLTSHRLFGKFYDRFSSLFLCYEPACISEKLFDFCKKYIEYREEGVDKQTTALPTGFLTRGFGDCKHYALFNAGVLASLNRLYGTDFKWCFYFDGYRDAEEPFHVYVAVRDGTEEIWIDPTPGAGSELPTIHEKRVV